MRALSSSSIIIFEKTKIGPHHPLGAAENFFVFCFKLLKVIVIVYSLQHSSFPQT